MSQMGNIINELKLCKWYINGLVNWKDQHKEFIELINKNGLAQPCITESWKCEALIKLLEREVAS